jgi:hypothetical protein
MLTHIDLADDKNSSIDFLVIKTSEKTFKKKGFLGMITTTASECVEC